MPLEGETVVVRMKEWPGHQATTINTNSGAHVMKGVNAVGRFERGSVSLKGRLIKVPSFVHYG